MDTYGKIKELEKRIEALEARLRAIEAAEPDRTEQRTARGRKP